MTRSRDIANLGDGVTAADITDATITAAKMADGAVEGAFTTQIGRRNLIINGAYTIWQRATTSSSNGVNTADRWQQNDATFTQETSIVPDNFQYSMKVVANGSGTPLLLQKIERPQVCGHIVNQDITVSFYARSSNVNAITKLELNDEGGSGGRPDGGSQTLSAADTWERITHTFTAPFSSLTGNSVAVILTFATSATVYISGFQVEVGSVATPFEHRSYGEELALCQRYYQLVTNGNMMVAGTTSIYLNPQFFCEMRSTPSISQTGVFSINNRTANRIQSSTGHTFYAGDTRGVFIDLLNFSSLLTDSGVSARYLNTNAVVLDAEL